MKDSSDNIFAVVLDKVRAINEALIAEGVLPAGIDQGRVQVEPTREAAHGDMATNAAMVLAKEAGRKPRELADAIAAKLRSDDIVAKVEVAGPGFINLTLKPVAWIDALRAVLREGADYGRSSVGQGAAVDVEYVSEEEGVEVTVEAQHTTICSAFAPWADLVASLGEPA